MNPSDPRPEPVAETQPEARDRLVEAAERLFARHGFAATSVRDITKAADCNVAAINYHFGGKENLYREVFRRGLNSLRERRIGSIHRTLAEAADGATLEMLLEAFTAAFLEPVVGSGRVSPFVELIARELMDPQLPRDVFRDELIGPVREALSDALQATCSGLDGNRARLCVQSVVAQLVHVIHHHRQFGEWSDASLPLHEVVSHIVRFSAGGIRALARDGS